MCHRSCTPFLWIKKILFSVLKFCWQNFFWTLKQLTLVLKAFKAKETVIAHKVLRPFLCQWCKPGSVIQKWSSSCSSDCDLGFFSELESDSSETLVVGVRLVWTVWNRKNRSSDRPKFGRILMDSSITL